MESPGGSSRWPLGDIIAGVNVHDTKLLAAMLEASVVARPQPTEERPHDGARHRHLLTKAPLTRAL
jgi:hypothetical protein